MDDNENVALLDLKLLLDQLDIFTLENIATDSSLNYYLNWLDYQYEAFGPEEYQRRLREVVTLEIFIEWLENKLEAAKNNLA